MDATRIGIIKARVKNAKESMDIVLDASVFLSYAEELLDEIDDLSKSRRVFKNYYKILEDVLKCSLISHQNIPIQSAVAMIHELRERHLLSNLFHK